MINILPIYFASVFIAFLGGHYYAHIGQSATIGSGVIIIPIIAMIGFIISTLANFFQHDK